MDLHYINEGKKFCPHSIALKPSLRMTIDQWKDVVDVLTDLGCGCINLCVSRQWPFLRELADYIRERDRGLSIVSNGYKISGYDAKYLAGIGTCSISLRVDCASLNPTKPSPDSFHNAISSIIHIKELSIRTVVFTSVRKNNLGELPILKRCLSECEVDLWQLLIRPYSISPDQHLILLEFIRQSKREYIDGKPRIEIIYTNSVPSGRCVHLSERCYPCS